MTDGQEEQDKKQAGAIDRKSLERWFLREHNLEADELKAHYPKDEDLLKFRDEVMADIKNTDLDLNAGDSLPEVEDNYKLSASQARELTQHGRRSTAEAKIKALKAKKFSRQAREAAEKIKRADEFETKTDKVTPQEVKAEMAKVKKQIRIKFNNN